MMRDSQIIVPPAGVQVSREDMLDLVARFVHAMTDACIDLSSPATRYSRGRERRRKNPRLRLDLSLCDKHWTSAREQHRHNTTTTASSSPTTLGFEWREQLFNLQTSVACRDGRSVAESAMQSLFTFTTTSAEEIVQKERLLQFLFDIVQARQQGRVRRLRGLFYENKSLYKSSAGLYGTARKLAKYWGNVHTSAFGAIAAVKGLIAGPIKLIESDASQTEEESVTGESTSVCQRSGSPDEYSVRPILDVSCVTKIELLRTIPWVAVIEKDTVFTERVAEVRQLVQDGEDAQRTGGLLITGKGMPDHATRRLVEMLVSVLPESTPFYLLVDGDAYGMAIAEAYKRQFFHSTQTRRPFNVQWVGLKPSSWRQWQDEVIHSSHVQGVVDNSLSSHLNPLSFDDWRDELTEEDTLPTERSSTMCNDRSAVSLDAEEYTRALGMLRRPILFAEQERELCKLVMYGFKMELEMVKQQSLLSLLPS